MTTQSLDPKHTLPPKKVIQKVKEKTHRPKYNMWQNSIFMIKLAWSEKEKKVLVLCLLTALLAVAGDLVNLYITPSILAAVENHVTLKELLHTILFFVGCTMLLGAARSYIGQNTLYGRVTLRSAIIAMLNHKMCCTSYPNTDDEKLLKMLGETDNALNSNSGAGEAIWNTLTNLFQNILGFIIYLALISNVEPILVVVILITSLANYFISKPLNEFQHRHKDEYGECYQRFSTVQSYAENPKMAKDIRIFGLSAWLQDIYTKTIDVFTALERRSANRMLFSRIVNLLLIFLQNGVAYAYLIHMVLNGDLTAASFLLYFSAVGNFSGWVGGILNNILALHRQSLEISNIRECIEYPEIFRFEDGESLTADPNGQYEIRLENLSYRYPAAENDTLQNINLTLHPGEKLAIVGLNGAGKTTLIKLLCGFLDPTQGQVLLNGRDIREYNRMDYYELFSAVFQHYTLLPASVAANVAQSEDDIDMLRVRDCIEKAGLTEKIESLPEKYENKLNRKIYEDAVMLSGGEEQRLMLARALYKDAPVIVLDEPTAALDPLAEADLYNKYHEMTKNRSSVYISHRLASTRFCDRIILIENGGIAEEGTHAELLERNGRYAELFEIQSKYYREEANANE